MGREIVSFYFRSTYSYTVSHALYSRPKSMNDIASQEQVVRVLQKALTSENVGGYKAWI